MKFRKIPALFLMLSLLLVGCSGPNTQSTTPSVSEASVSESSVTEPLPSQVTQPSTTQPPAPPVFSFDVDSPVAYIQYEYNMGSIHDRYPFIRNATDVYQRYYTYNFDSTVPPKTSRAAGWSLLTSPEEFTELLNLDETKREFFTRLGIRKSFQPNELWADELFYSPGASSASFTPDEAFFEEYNLLVADICVDYAIDMDATPVSYSYSLAGLAVEIQYSTRIAMTATHKGCISLIPIPKKYDGIEHGVSVEFTEITASPEEQE